VAGVGKRKAAGVAQHVRMGLEIEAGSSPDTLDHLGEASAVENGEPRSLTNTNDDAQPMAIGQQDHRRVAVIVAVALGGLDQRLGVDGRTRG
jgi:hypothetical protein